MRTYRVPQGKDVNILLHFFSFMFYKLVLLCVGSYLDPNRFERSDPDQIREPYPQHSWKWMNWHQCCGSGLDSGTSTFLILGSESEIEGEKKSWSRIRVKHLGPYIRELSNNFWLCCGDPGSVLLNPGSGRGKFGPGINFPDPQNWLTQLDWFVCSRSKIRSAAVGTIRLRGPQAQSSSICADIDIWQGTIALVLWADHT